jgi:quinol monooxygenase YgiN
MSEQTTIRPGSGVTTLINVFTVDPTRQQQLVDVLTQATQEVIRHLPGFVSANIHASLDGTKVVNYAQWESREALEAMLADSRARPHLDEAAALGSFEPNLYEVAFVHHR